MLCQCQCKCPPYAYIALQMLQHYHIPLLSAFLRLRLCLGVDVAAPPPPLWLSCLYNKSYKPQSPPSASSMLKFEANVLAVLCSVCLEMSSPKLPKTFALCALVFLPNSSLPSISFPQLPFPFPFLLIFLKLVFKILQERKDMVTKGALSTASSSIS